MMDCITECSWPPQIPPSLTSSARPWAASLPGACTKCDVHRDASRVVPRRRAPFGLAVPQLRGSPRGPDRPWPPGATSGPFCGRPPGRATVHPDEHQRRVSNRHQGAGGRRRDAAQPSFARFLGPGARQNGAGGRSGRPGAQSLEQRRHELMEPRELGARVHSAFSRGAPGSSSICSPPGRTCCIRGGRGQVLLQLQLLARLCRPAEAANLRERHAASCRFRVR